MQTIFRADVDNAMLDGLVLPSALSLNPAEARMLATWAQGVCRDTFNEPGHDPHFKDLKGSVAKGAMMLMDGRLAGRIKPLVTFAARHGLLMSMGSSEHGGRIRLRVDRKQDTPMLGVTDKNATTLLETIGYVDPTARGYANLEMMERMLARSRSDCDDNCMGHYYAMLCTIAVYARANGGNGIYWGRDTDTPETVGGRSTGMAG